jgi:hypothetical protein
MEPLQILKVVAAVAIGLLVLPGILADPGGSIGRVDSCIGQLPGIVAPLWGGFVEFAVEFPVCAGAALIALVAIFLAWSRRK